MHVFYPPKTAIVSTITINVNHEHTRKHSRTRARTHRRPARCLHVLQACAQRYNECTNAAGACAGASGATYVALGCGGLGGQAVITVRLMSQRTHCDRSSAASASWRSCTTSRGQRPSCRSSSESSGRSRARRSRSALWPAATYTHHRQKGTLRAFPGRSVRHGQVVADASATVAANQSIGGCDCC